MAFERMRVFTGNANPKLAEAVCRHLNISLGRCVVGRFSDGEVMVELLENVRGRDIFILQSTCVPTNDNLMEILVMADALKRASAGRITAAIPYFGYARQDRRPRSARVAITAKVVADMLTTVGVNRVMVMDLHADQIQGFFNIPVDNIYATPILLGDLWKQNYEDLLVVSPDVGGVVRARAIAKRLDSDLAIIDKRRPRANVVRGDEHHRRRQRAHLRDHGRHRRHREHAVQGRHRAEGARREEGRRVLHAPRAVRRRGPAHRDVRARRDRRHRHDPADRRGARRCPRIRAALLRAAARRDDDARVERGVGELAVHGVAADAATPRPAGLAQLGQNRVILQGFPAAASGIAGLRRMSPTADDRPDARARSTGATGRPQTSGAASCNSNSPHLPRTTEGRGASRRMRRAGKAPGIVYGGADAPQPIELDHNALFHALRNEAFHASILTMKLGGAATKVLLRDVQMHPFRNEILHVDFQRVDENRKIHMKVPLHFVNGEISPAVKVSGAIVSHVRHRARHLVPAEGPAGVHRGRPVDARRRPLGPRVGAEAPAGRRRS